MQTKVALIALLLASLIPLRPSLAAAFHNPYGHPPTNSTIGDRMFADYFRAETRRLADSSLAEIHTRDDWNGRKDQFRRQLYEMLSLDPLPPKTDLHATVTGTIDHPEFTVEKLYFQSMPGLYVTANLYLPKHLEKPAPAILYVCGHSPVKTNGVSFGCKVTYQHHGIWFARNGYVCLVLDTVELGEVEGRHHGTYRDGMWWWNSRGYTSGGAEAWNVIRALDYLETRPEVDKSRFGVTGRSGGGATSWWIAALDERIQAACPVAGITDLENHVIDGTVEGHCDCMFPVNTYRWDFPQVAALVAPRPLLICNTDKDTIFPLDGVSRLHQKVRQIYDLCGATDQLGLLITEGEHHDTQDLQVPVLRWFNRFLMHQERLVETAAAPLFSGQQLKVFDQLPSDEVTSKCFENFVKLASDRQPLASASALDDLRRKTFGGWPISPTPLNAHLVSSTESEGLSLSIHELDSQPGVTLRFYVAQPVGVEVREVRFEVVDEPRWRRQLDLARIGFAAPLSQELAAAGVNSDQPVATENTDQFTAWKRNLRERQIAYVTFAPRGIGLTALTSDQRYVTQVRRRFMLLGQTLAGMQVWDLRRSLQAARALPGFANLPLHLRASPEMTEVAAFATLFEPGLTSLVLAQPPRADKDSPDFLNWSRILTPSQLFALIQTRCNVTTRSP